MTRRSRKQKNVLSLRFSMSGTKRRRNSTKNWVLELTGPTTQTGFGMPPRHERSRFNTFCFRCGKSGHWDKDCWSYRRADDLRRHDNSVEAENSMLTQNDVTLI